MSIHIRNCVTLVLLFLAGSVQTYAKETQNGWAEQVELPASEQRVELFNGHDLTGWEGIEQYYSVEDGTIRAANEEPVPSSTYLFTNDSYRDFRLLLEVKQTMGKKYSTMHSAVAALGERAKIEAGNFGYRGPLLMFCHDWGIWGADGRGRVYPPGRKGPIQKPPYEKIGDWNQIEILVVGNHIRVVSNGKLVVDYTEKDPKRIRKGPLGLQLHHNKQPQEWHFRGLVLVENPKDELVTLDKQK